MITTLFIEVVLLGEFGCCKLQLVCCPPLVLVHTVDESCVLAFKNNLCQVMVEWPTILAGHFTS